MKRAELELVLFHAEQETKDNGKRCALLEQRAREHGEDGRIKMHRTNPHLILHRRGEEGGEGAWAVGAESGAEVTWHGRQKIRVFRRDLH